MAGCRSALCKPQLPWMVSLDMSSLLDLEGPSSFLYRGLESFFMSKNSSLWSQSVWVP